MGLTVFIPVQQLKIRRILQYASAVNYRVFPLTVSALEVVKICLGTQDREKKRERLSREDSRCA